MANRSVNTLSNQLNNSTFADMDIHGDSVLLNPNHYYSNNDSFMMNNFMRSFDVNCRKQLNSSCSHFAPNIVDETSQLFTLIDLGQSLIRSIKRENEIVSNMNALDYLSPIIFHKIREIDLIKLLLLVQEKIEISSKVVLSDDTCFSKEVLSQLFELDSIFNECFFSQVNDVDVTEKFDLSASIVDSILHDCNSDLSKLDRSITKIFQGLEKKQHSGVLSNSRTGRLFQKTIEALQHDVVRHLRTIDVILDRLFHGFSKNITNCSHLKVPQDFLLEFHTEIDEKQYQNIVYLKHFHLELEQRALSRILTLTEGQLVATLSNQDNAVSTKFNSTLSPIKNGSASHHTPNVQIKRSMLTSTPSMNNTIRRNCYGTTDYDDDLISEGDEPSVLSRDSGILPTSENDLSSITSQETLDIVAQPDDDCEKNNDTNSHNEADAETEDSDCFGSVSTNSDRKKHSQQSTIEDVEHGSPVDALSSTRFLDVRSGFDNYEHVVSVLRLPQKRKDEMRTKMKDLFLHQESTVKFNCALSLTIYMSNERPCSDSEETLLQLEGTFFNLMNINIRQLSNKHKCSSVLDNQVNNSACSTYSISKFHTDINTQNDQNTNNNADSKDDESSDLCTSSEDLPNEHSVCADANDFSESPSNELIANSDTSHEDSTHLNCVTENYNDTTVSEPTDPHWQQYDSLVATESLRLAGDNLDGSLILEDIELALRLSELHLKVEFENETTINDALVTSKIKVIEKYQDVELKTRSRISELGNSGDCHVPCNHVERPLSNNSAQSDYSARRSSPEGSENISHDDESMSFTQRIQLTISLSKRLLTVTRTRLDLIASLSKNKNVSKLVSKKTLSIYPLRQRLHTISKVLGNLEFSIKCSAKSEEDHDCLSQIHEVVTNSEQLAQFTYKLEEHMKTTISTTDDADIVDYLDELPDDLLATLDPLDMESILSISIGRLHVTISALTQYPCYDMLIKTSLKTFAAHKTTLIPSKVDFKTPLSNCELIREIHKLRRITAICALNIVDLHVIIAKMEENTSLGYEDKISEMKELLLVWRIIDKECHRLLRCNSLIQRVLMDCRRTYVELVSLTAVMQSVFHTVNLSSLEKSLLDEHMDNVHTYKLKIVDWLQELELCSSALHKKRITNKRFKFYEDIHKFLEENLKSIAELADHIKLGCRGTVKSLNNILSYCSDLSSFPVTVLDAAMNTSNVLDNRLLDSRHCLIKSDVLATMADLAVTENNVCQLQALLDQGKDLFVIILAGDLSADANKDYVKQSPSPREEANMAEYHMKESDMIENATLSLTEKISSIATQAASKALLLFVDKTCAEPPFGNLPLTSENEYLLDDAVEDIVDDITAMMTGLLIENVNNIDDTYNALSCKLIFNDVCRQLGDKALHFLVDTLLVDFPKIEDGFICDTSTDLAQYFSEELSHFMIDDCVNSLPLNDTVSCIGSCVSQLQRKLSQRLFEKSVLYIANSVGSSQEEGTQLSAKDQFRDFPSPIPTYRLSRKVTENSVSPEEVLTKVTRLLLPDSLSSINYHCDVRRRVFLRSTASRVSSSSNLRIASEKISKLVARFDRGVLEEEMLDGVAQCDRAIDREFLRAVNIESNEVEQDPTNESFCALQDVSVEHACSSSVLNESYLTEVVQDLDRPALASLKRKCSAEVCEPAKVRRVSSSDELVRLEAYVSRRSASIPVNVHEDLVESSSSVVVVVQQHTALTLHSDVRESCSHCLQNDDDDNLGESDSDSDDTTCNISITSSGNYKQAKDAVAALSITLDQDVISSVERVLGQVELHSVSEMTSQGHVQCTVCEGVADTECHCMLQSCLSRRSVHGSLSSANPQHVIIGHDYEATLSRLWLFVFGVFLLLLLGLLFHDRINSACRCLGSGKSLIPSLVSSGLPF